MRLNSIKFKLLFIIVTAFIAMTISVLYLADTQLTPAIDETQEAVYAEKIVAILESLHRTNDRLKQTGLVEAYAQDFKESILKVLRKTYYKHAGQSIYPFIIDTEGKVVMHPSLPVRDLSLAQTEIVGKMLAASEGDFDYTYLEEEKWLLFKHFPEWDWVIGYAVPLNIKYAVTRRFRNILALIIVIISVLVLLVLSWIISRFMQPIIQLTEVSSEIAAGNLDQAIGIGSKDEIGTLALRFTDMRDSIRNKILELEQENAERRKAEKEQERLNAELKIKNKELEQVLYVTSHDLRSPLVNVEGYSKELDHSLNELMSSIEKVHVPSGLKDKIALMVKKDIPESLNYIQISVSKMGTLLNGILSLFRLGRSELTIEDIDMNKMMTDIVKTHSFKLKELRIKTEVSKLPNCKGDSSQINQVFSNLLDNAIKYSESERSCVINISGYKDMNQSIYCMDDNGLGIAPEHQDKIFEIFHRLEPNMIKGEGMGLTIAHRIIEKHKGRMWVESEPGKGSKFFVALPE
jgi:signal transduction histidine kinase